MIVGILLFFYSVYNTTKNADSAYPWYIGGSVYGGGTATVTDACRLFPGFENHS